MKAAVSLLVLFALHSVPVSHSTNWLRRCQNATNSNLALEVLPGGGWDNLRNLDLGRVMNFSYFQCRVTEDGMYLIPDEVFVIPHKETGVETNSEIIHSWLEDTSYTAKSINADLAYKSLVNGRFSVENQRMKIHQIKDLSVTTRVQVRNLIYTVKVNPDFSLDSRFVQQAIAIANAIVNNQTKNAEYLSERMVLDYGTHVITSVDAGATLVKEDYLTSSYVSTNLSSSIKAHAGLSFFKKLAFDLNGEMAHETSYLETYESNIQYSIIQSHGSTPFYPGITLKNWQESIKNNLVAVDRSGSPLHYFINTYTFPDLPQSIVGKVAVEVSKAIERYYTINTRPGCVDVNSRNFNFQANVNDDSCYGPSENLSFGGIYQECIKLTADADPLCDALSHKNTATGNFSCPSPFSSTLLRSEIRQQGYSSYNCFDQKYHCGLFHCHRRVCQEQVHVRSARVNTYWCYVIKEESQNSGYLFGGIYSPSLLNPITNDKSCPPNYISSEFLSDGQVMCLSKDYETGTRYAVKFGGLFSCESTNPMAGSQGRCPPEFSQHLASVSDGCEILFCVQSGVFTNGQLLPIHLPPFTIPPIVSTQNMSTIMVMSEGGKKWLRSGSTNTWKLVNLEDPKEVEIDFQSEDSEMTAGQKTGLAFGVMGVMVLLIIVAVLVVKKRRRLPRFTRITGYEEICGNDEQDVSREERQQV